MGVVAVEAMNLANEMLAPLEIDPLLMMGPRMALQIPPFTRFQVVIFSKGLPDLVRLIGRFIPRVIVKALGNTGSTGMALATNFNPPLEREFSGIDDVSLPGAVYMSRPGPVAFLASCIQF